MLQRPALSRLLLMIFGSSFLLNLSFGTYRSIFNNFAVQELNISYGYYGLLEGIREIPGLLTILLIAGASRLRDEQTYAISGLLIGVGIAMYAGAQTYADLIIATLIHSVGFHMWQVVQNSLVIKAADQGERALRLGQINSAAAAATLTGMAIVWFTGQWISLRLFFIVAGLAGVAGALLSLTIPTSGEVVRRVALVFNWRYRSYYILTLLSGARRHIVLTFAAFALVKAYGTSVQTMALLLALHSFMSIWTRPMIGRIIDRVGEQRALSINYGIVAAVFLGYALTREVWVVYGLFIIDNVLTGFDIAIATHAGRLIPREELSSSLATGTTINHIFGVAVPVAGGILWELFGQTIPFLMGVAIVLVAMVYSWNLDARSAHASPPRAAGY